MSNEPKEREYTVRATVTLKGAWMVVMATSEAEARRIAETEPDFEIGGAEMTDWTVTSIDRL
jgi:hypothetical protein